MLCINNKYTDAYFNIAAEEYLLKNSSENIFMLYRNEPSVILGKNQNVWAEVNIEFAEKHQIKIVRRFSGGGAVFHDLGNLNFSFIENGENQNFDKFTNLMIDVLSNFGIHAQSDKRRALTIGGLKISGSAQAIHKNRTLYHATLLYSSDLTNVTTLLDGNILMDPNDRQNKLYVKSVKSPVTNTLKHLVNPMEIDDFSELIMNYFLDENMNNIPYEFTDKDLIRITELKNNKYSTHEWNYDACVVNDKQEANVSTIKL